MELELKQISYQYQANHFLLSPTDWQLPLGEIHCWLGRSGSGKSTLLQIAAGLKVASSGEVLYRGKRAASPLSSTGFVFQSPTLLAWKTVVENVLLPIQLQREITKKDVDYAYSLLELLQIKAYAKASPSELSGGQKSRVSIARALITKPSLLFLDEPFAALDFITREELQLELLSLVQARDIAMVLVTHDVSEAAFLADKVGVLSNGYLTKIEDSPFKNQHHLKNRHSTECLAFGMRIRELLEVANA